MNEKPMEWMAECKESNGHKIGRIACLAAAVALFVFFILTAQLFSVIGAVIFGGLYGWLQMRAFVEYEYCYFSDEVDVAVIYNRARRKKKMSFQLSELEYAVKKIEPQENTKYFCSKDNQGNLYSLILNQNGKRTAVIMEVSPEFLQVLEMKRKVR